MESDFNKNILNNENTLEEKTSFEKPHNKKNQTLLKALIKEIKSENIKIVLFNIFAWIGFIFFALASTIFILEKLDIFSWDIVKNINKNFNQWLLLFLILIPGFLGFLLLVIYSQLTKYRFDQEKKYHFQYEEEIDLNRVPNFIISKYKRIIGGMIWMNWFAVVSYLISTLMLVFFLLFRNQSELTIEDIKISLSDGKSFPDYKNNIIGTSIYLGSVFCLHLTFIIFSIRRKSKLVALFDLENRLNHEDIRAHKRNTHIICFCVFVLPVVITFLMIWLLKRVFKKS